jgi:hypothetical protein
MHRNRLILVAAALIPVVHIPAQPADKKAREIAETMMQAMGGQDAWHRAHYVRFDFIVDIPSRKAKSQRSHLWDKKTGRYRLESTDKENRSIVTLFNAGTKEGEVYANGTKLEGSAKEAALKSAYGAFINDMYWLAMPWKWSDQGVNLKYLGQKTLRGKPFDVVQLTFGNVGLTPGDRYEAYVSPETHLMEHWIYVLQSGQKGAWDWQYTTSRGIKLASNHTDGAGGSINMGTVEVSDKVDEGLFTDPMPRLTGKAVSR